MEEEEERGREWRRGEDVDLCLMAETCQGRFSGSPRIVEKRSDSVPQTSLNSPGEEWARGGEGYQSEPAPLWKYPQSWLRSHVRETSILTSLSHLILDPH